MVNEFLEIRNISKSYGVVRALKDVSFGIKKGEVHTLLGENGAGKSTLIKIICGEQAPDSGQIVLDGTPVVVFNPKVAMAQGIAMVHQELAVFENMTVAQNIFPGCTYLKRGGFLDKKKMQKEAQEKIKMFGMDIDAGQKMDALTLAQQQMVEILRCISAGQKILLLDEPTSGLNNEEADKLMDIIEMLKQGGTTIIYISHRINEIMSVSDRITVMKDGTYVGTFDNDDTLTEAFLIGKMVGRELTDSLYAARTDRSEEFGETIFEVQGLSKKNSVSDISFSLKKGEILGFFGLEGSGTNAVSRMMYGLEAFGSGEVRYKGRKLRVSPDLMVQKGIMYLNNNRKNAGLLLDSPATDNISMPILKECSTGLMIDKKKVEQYTQKYIEEFNIVIPSVYQLPKNLSGGNQQKLMFSICLAKQPEMLIINEPTRGIDVGAKAEIHKYILGLVKKGISVIVFSSEMPELICLADRILVMHENRISGELAHGEISEELIMTAASGIAQ